MKAKLTFDLMDNEQKRKFKTALKADDLVFALREFDEHVLRQMIKYDPNLTQDQLEVLEKVRGELHDLLRDNDIDLDDLTC